MQALVVRLRTVWHKISSFEVGKIQEFLNPQPVFVIGFHDDVAINRSWGLLK